MASASLHTLARRITQSEMQASPQGEGDQRWHLIWSALEGIEKTKSKLDNPPDGMANLIFYVLHARKLGIGTRPDVNAAVRDVVAAIKVVKDPPAGISREDRNVLLDILSAAISELFCLVVDEYALRLGLPDSERLGPQPPEGRQFGLPFGTLQQGRMPLN